MKASSTALPKVLCYPARACARDKTIVGFYRPPNSSTEVMTKLHNCLATLRPQSFHNLVLCGDYNIDPWYNQGWLMHLQTDFQLTQVVDEPTRITNYSSSVIDLVFLSSLSSLISCDISLHWQLRIPTLYRLPLSLRLLQGIPNLQQKRSGCIAKQISL